MSKLEMIAAEAGVSKHTVARVLNGKTKEVWPSTIQRAENIRRLARKYNYRTNAAASAIRSKRFNATGLLLSSIMHKATIHWHTQAALLKAHHELDKHLIVGQLDDSQLTAEGQLPKLLRQWAVDGLLVFYTSEFPQQLVDMINNDRIPAVWMNADLPINAVHPDDMGAGYIATTKLIEAGHREIAYLYYGRQTHYSVQHRQAGYEKAMHDAGLKPTIHTQEIFPTWEIGQRTEHIQQVLTSVNRPTAIVASGPNTSMTTLYCASQLQMKVPDDLALIAIADLPIRELGIAVNTMVLDHDTFATESVKMMEQRIADRKSDIDTVTIPFIEVSGQTI
jgi:DNA-binding LacI/PurR family transcriptional regulator